MTRGRRPRAEQVVPRLRQIAVQTARGQGIAVARKAADVAEQSDDLLASRRPAA